MERSQRYVIKMRKREREKEREKECKEGRKEEEKKERERKRSTLQESMYSVNSFVNILGYIFGCHTGWW